MSLSPSQDQGETFDQDTGLSNLFDATCFEACCCCCCCCVHFLSLKPHKQHALRAHTQHAGRATPSSNRTPGHNALVVDASLEEANDIRPTVIAASSAKQPPPPPPPPQQQQQPLQPWQMQLQISCSKSGSSSSSGSGRRSDSSRQ